MQINDIMTEYVEVIAPEISIEEAAKKMRSLNVGVLPVCNGFGLVGMLTDRDVTIRAVAEGRDPKITTVEEVMTSEVGRGVCGSRLSEPDQVILLPKRTTSSFLFSLGW
jgi:CBS domain-containing protein